MADTGLAAHAVRRAVADFLHAHCGTGEHVIVAVSGGADSLALAAAVGQVASEGGWQPTAVIIDHGLQPGSDEVAAAAQRHCNRLGLGSALVMKVNVEADGEGLEAAARNARMAALQEQAHRLHAAGILLAHTRDDQAETVLMRLSRGSGARSLAGMYPVTQLGLAAKPLWRPLLNVERSLLRHSLDHYGIKAHEDPHNSDPRFLRARVRHELMPMLIDVLGEGAVSGLARTAELARQDAAALDELAGEHLLEARVEGQLLLEQLRGLPAALLSRVLRRWLIEAGVPGAALGFDQMAVLARLAIDPQLRGPVLLPGGVNVEKASGRLRAWRNDASS